MKGCLLALILLWPFHGMGAARFYVDTDKKELALGQMLVLSVHAENSEISLQQLQYGELKQDFEIFSTSLNSQTVVRGGRKVSGEVMALALYPHHAGQIRLPVLKFAGMKSQPLLLNVLEANAAAPRVQFKTGLTPLQPMMRQEAYLTLEVVDEGVVQWRTPKETTANGFSVRRLAESQREELLDGVRHTVTRYAWGVMPLRPGNLRIVFPNMEASKLGERLRYAVMPRLVEVSPLPSYLPVQMHVGVLKLSAQPLPQEIIVGRPLHWTLRLTGSGISREGIAKSLSKFTSASVGASAGKSAALDFYPAEFNLKDGVNIGADQDDPLGQTLDITLPFQARQAGEHVLPELRLAYFNPATGLIEMATLPEQRIQVTDPFWRKLSMGAMILVAMLAVILLVRYGCRRWQQRKLRRQWIASLAAAEDAAELRHALLAFGSGRTLRRWLRNWEIRHGENIELNNSIQQLEQSDFGREGNHIDIEFPVLRQRLLSALRYAQPVKSRPRPEAMREPGQAYLEWFSPPFDEPRINAPWIRYRTNRLLLSCRISLE